MVRNERYKLIKYIDRNFWPGSMTELFDIKEDPKELKNLAEERKEIRDNLELKIKRWEDKKLDKNPDPLRLIAKRDLPSKQWIRKLIEENKGDYAEWRRKMGW